MKISAMGTLCVTLFLLTSVAAGFGYPDAIGMGSPLPGNDAVSHGFGGASVTDVGGLALFGNPAILAESNTNLMMNAGALILKQTVDDGLGKHTLTYAGLGTTSFQAAFSAGGMSYGLGIAKVRDYTYKGEYFFLETAPDTIIAGYENLVVDGGVWEASAGLAKEVVPGVKIGASAGYRTGTINYEYYWHHFSESIDDSTSNWSREEGEFAWRAGACFKVGESTTIGAAYASESENCPSNIAAGVLFGEISEGFPGVGIEAKVYDTPENTSWSATVFGGVHPEHNLFFRGGLTLSSRGGNDANAALGIALGTTVNFSWMDLHAAFNYNGESRDGDVFGFPDAETTDDIVTAFSVGATIPL